MHWMMRLLVVLMIVLFSLPGAAQNVEDDRLARLARGINIEGWFWQYDGFETFTGDLDAHFATFMDGSDAAAIRSLGLLHVRLPIEPNLFFDPALPAPHADETYLPALDAAVRLLIEADLAVIVDLHADEPLRRALATDDAVVTQYTAFLAALAGRMEATFPPDYVLIEPLNEPAFSRFLSENENGINMAFARWTAVQPRMLAAMRVAAPSLTFVAKGYSWDGIDALTLMTPYNTSNASGYVDANIVYNFHFYYPQPFTHQGAWWTDETAYEYMRDIPYPVTGEGVRAAIDAADALCGCVVDYLYQWSDVDWDTPLLESLVQQAADWGDLFNVPVTVNEFGVLRGVAPDAARQRWLTETRSLFEQYGIGWTLWDYDDAFGLFAVENGERVLDVPTAQSLGLSVGGA